jgi:hypothetical protein
MEELFARAKYERITWGGYYDPQGLDGHGARNSRWTRNSK